jgi:phosphoadenosine phosphosulfate reductase
MLGNVSQLRHHSYYRKLLQRPESAGLKSGGSGISMIKMQESMGSQTVVSLRSANHTRFEELAQRAPSPVVARNDKNARFKQLLRELSEYFAGLSFQNRLRLINDLHGKKAVQVASMQRTATMIMHGLYRCEGSVRVALIDTGYLPPETLRLAAKLSMRLGNLRIETIKPSASVEQQNARQGPDLWKTHEGQAQCCDLRKTQPLLSFLKSRQVEATVKGLLRADGGNRARIAPIEYDPRTDTMSYHPLFDHTRADIEAYVTENKLPEHEWYSKDYLSIGCAPCTTPCKPGEDVRAGRWRHLNEGGQQGGKKQYCGINLGDRAESQPSLLTPPTLAVNKDSSSKSAGNPYAAMLLKK